MLKAMPSHRPPVSAAALGGGPAHDYVEHAFGCHRFLPFRDCSF
jgi:hypothetical protein